MPMTDPVQRSPFAHADRNPVIHRLYISGTFIALSRQVIDSSKEQKTYPIGFSDQSTGLRSACTNGAAAFPTVTGCRKSVCTAFAHKKARRCGRGCCLGPGAVHGGFTLRRARACVLGSVRSVALPKLSQASCEPPMRVRDSAWTAPAPQGSGVRYSIRREAGSVRQGEPACTGMDRLCASWPHRSACSHARNWSVRPGLRGLLSFSLHGSLQV